MYVIKVQSMDNKITIMEKYIIPALIVIGTFLLPVLYWFLAIGFFIGADLALRLVLCKRNKVLIVSDKMWRTVYKFMGGCVFILVAYACQILFVPDIPMMKIAGGYLILVELKSIDEKAFEMTGYSLFNIVINKLTPDKKP